MREATVGEALPRPPIVSTLSAGMLPGLLLRPDLSLTSVRVKGIFQLVGRKNQALSLRENEAFSLSRTQVSLEIPGTLLMSEMNPCLNSPGCKSWFREFISHLSNTGRSNL